MEERIFGHIDGVPVGTIFPNRTKLAESKVHRPPEAGICGGQNEGAESIVLSGGYIDDEDYGNRVIYTGHGGKDPKTNRQIEDQKFQRGNKALAVSCDLGLPVRITRGSRLDSEHAPAEGYRYDGLYIVNDYWPEIGVDGYKIWRFELIQLEDLHSFDKGSRDKSLPTDPGGPASRKETTTYRVVRDTKIGRKVKKLHNNECQICGNAPKTLTGPYVEAAHIRPLGTPHDGPDAENNILSLCPNCHIRFDRLAVYIEDGSVYETVTKEKISDLRTVPGHEIDVQHTEYQRGLCLASVD